MFMIFRGPKVLDPKGMTSMVSVYLLHSLEVGQGQNKSLANEPISSESPCNLSLSSVLILHPRFLNSKLLIFLAT